jgi:hypothetical protein
MPRLHHRRWRPEKEFAFGRGALARPLRIYIDAENTARSDALDLLVSFAAHDHVEVLATDGSTPDRAVVGPLDTKHGYRPFNVERADGSGFISGVAGNAPDIAIQYAEPGQEAEAERLMTFAQAAADHGSDALVTGSSLLLDGFPRNLVKEANPMTPASAVALLGLFLRAREDSVFSIEGNFREGMDRETFYFILMRDLTPSGWRWFSGCVANAQHTGDDGLMMIAQSAMERIEHALRARDRLHERLQLPPTRETATDAIFYFNVLLLLLGGALDALALVAHRTHGINMDEHLVGWGRAQWTRELRHVDQPLAQMMDQGQPHRDARDLVAVMRNTIHSEALRSVTWHVAGTRDERITVPAAVTDHLEKIVSRLGSSAEFGLSRESDGRAYVEPGMYVEAMFPVVMGAVNAVMDATPVESLPGVQAGALMREPPDDAFFSAARRSRVRLFSGLR